MLFVTLSGASASTISLIAGSEHRGYEDDAAATMQNCTIDAMATSPRVTSVGLGNCPPLVSCWHLSDVFADETADLGPTNVVAAAVT